MLAPHHWQAKHQTGFSSLRLFVSPDVDPPLNTMLKAVDIDHMRMVDELLARMNIWLAENPRGRSDGYAWEAADAVLTAATYDDLGEAIREILEATKADDKDAKDVVTAFSRLHPPQSLSNPERQRSLVGNYLVLRQEELWETSVELG